MAANLEFDDTFEAGETEAEEDTPPKKSNPLRIVLLVLLVLVLLCVVCYGGSRLLGSTLANLIPAQVQSMLPAGVLEAPVMETPPATQEPPPPGTSEPAPTQEPQPPPATSELPATTQPTEPPIAPPEPPLVSTEQPVMPTEEPVIATEQPPVTAPTTEPVPGPTATPTLSPPETVPETGPTVVVTLTGCDNNTPPLAEANGPYTAMMGKGLALVNFDATGSQDADGTITKYEWNFGDGSTPGIGQKVTYGYKNTGKYVVILTVTDNCNATAEDTTEVTIVGPTPPTPNGSQTPMPTQTATPAPNQHTMGFCYLVQYGDTLSGIAWYYGLAVQDLAVVNGVSPEYYVLAGQGLFIPMGQITTGRNAYQAQAGDTLYGLAYQCGLTPAALAKANNLDTNATLSPGQVIIVPLGR